MLPNEKGWTQPNLKKLLSHPTSTIIGTGIMKLDWLNHWIRVMHVCFSKLTITNSDNSLSPRRRQAIIWTSARISLIGPLGTNFDEISIEIHTFSFKKIHMKMSPGKWWPSCLGLNVPWASMVVMRLFLSLVPALGSPQDPFTGMTSDKVICVSINFCTFL